MKCSTKLADECRPNTLSVRLHPRIRERKNPHSREDTMKPRRVYLSLCVLGLLVPNSLLLPWIVAHGPNPQRFAQDLFANGVSSFFGMDVVLSALALAAFVLIEGRRIGLTRRWVPLVATCIVGVSLG